MGVRYDQLYDLQNKLLKEDNELKWFSAVKVVNLFYMCLQLLPIFLAHLL